MTPEALVVHVLENLDAKLHDDALSRLPRPRGRRG